MKIAIYIEGGLIQAVRSDNASTPLILSYNRKFTVIDPAEEASGFVPVHDFEIEIVDKDNEPKTAEDRWEELQGELEFGNY